jgi:hypothetical protein
MSTDEHDEVAMTEAIAAMLNIARLTRTYYIELVEQGWPEDEAFRLTMGWQHAVAGGKA